MKINTDYKDHSTDHDSNEINPPSPVDQTSSLKATSNQLSDYDLYCNLLSQIVYNKSLNEDDKLNQTLALQQEFSTRIDNSILTEDEKKNLHFKFHQEFKDAQRAIWKQKMDAYMEAFKTISHSNLSETEKNQKFKEMEAEFSNSLSNSQLSKDERKQVNEEIKRRFGETTKTTSEDKINEEEKKLLKLWKQKFSDYVHDLGGILYGKDSSADPNLKLNLLRNVTTDFSQSVYSSNLSSEEKDKLGRALDQEFDRAVAFVSKQPIKGGDENTKLQEIWKQKFSEYIQNLGNIVYIGDPSLTQNDKLKYLRSLAIEFSYDVNSSNLSSEDKEKFFRDSDREFDKAVARVSNQSSNDYAKTLSDWKQKFSDYIQNLGSIAYKGDPSLTQNDKLKYLRSIATEFSYDVNSSNLSPEDKEKFFRDIDRECDKAVAMVNKMVTKSGTDYAKTLGDWKEKFNSFIQDLGNVVYRNPSMNESEKRKNLEDLSREFSYSVNSSNLSQEDKEKFFRDLNQEFDKAVAKISKNQK